MPFVKPVMTMGETVLVPESPEVQLAIYPVMTLPPSVAGALKAIVA